MVENKVYNEKQKKAIKDLVIAERSGYLGKKNNEYYANKLDKLNVPYSVQNKAVYISKEEPNLYVNQVVEKSIK